MSKNRIFTDTHDIVQRLCGMIEPVGDSNVDEIRLDNLEDTIFVAERLIDDILNIVKYKSEWQHSMSVAGHRAERFQDELYERLADSYGLIPKS